MGDLANQAPVEIIEVECAGDCGEIAGYVSSRWLTDKQFKAHQDNLYYGPTVMCPACGEEAMDDDEGVPELNHKQGPT